VFVNTYKSAIKKEKEILIVRQKIIEMDEKMEKFVMDSIKKLQEDVTNLRIDVGKIKGQSAIYAGVVFGVCTIVAEVLKSIL